MTRPTCPRRLRPGRSSGSRRRRAHRNRGERACARHCCERPWCCRRGCGEALRESSLTRLTLPSASVSNIWSAVSAGAALSVGVVAPKEVRLLPGGIHHPTGAGRRVGHLERAHRGVRSSATLGDAEGDDRTAHADARERSAARDARKRPRRVAAGVRTERLVVGHLDLIDLAVAVRVEELQRRSGRRRPVPRDVAVFETVLALPAGSLTAAALTCTVDRAVSGASRSSNR